MKKVFPYLGAALSALAVAMTAPAQAQDVLKDVPAEHWAFQAVKELAEKGILIGYPDGFFKGRRYLTRYELAVALQRLLKQIGSSAGAQGPAGETGPQGAPGTPGPRGDAGITPEELNMIKRAADEFARELRTLGTDLSSVKAALSSLEKRVSAIEGRLAKMPDWNISAFGGIRTDHSRFPFVDKGGAGRAGLRSFSSVEVLHDLHLKPSFKLKDGVTFTGDIAVSNYFGYRGNTFSQASAALNPLFGPIVTAETITPIQAQIDTPIKGFGSETQLTIGRYKQHLTPLTLMRPDLDPYFYIGEYDDGNYVQDGFKLSTKLGSLKAQVFAGSYATATTNLGLAFNRPLVGGGIIGVGGNVRAGKPFGIDPLGNTNAASQAFGIHLGLPFFNMGNLGFTAAVFGTGLPAGANPANPFNTVNVYGVNFKLNNMGRLKINAEASKSVTGTSISTSDGQGNEDNNAFALHAAYGSGPIDLKVGYNYIDPRFGAPGSWMQLGNWVNPTNVRGPYLNIGYKLSDNIQASIGGDYLEGARNRAGYFNISDRIGRVKAGLKYQFSKRLSLGLDYEGVLYDLSAATTGLATRTKPIEQYLTFGAGVSVNSAATLKIGYQMINFQNIGGGFGAGTGIAGVGGGGNSSNASVFTTSLAVKF